MKFGTPIYFAALGVELSAAMSNIVGGQVASQGAAPYIVSIRKQGQHYCGGSLINERFVLTAGHCLMDNVASTFTVVAGSNSVQQGGTARNVTSGLEHPDFDAIKRINDLGLLKLSEPMPLGKDIKPIDLFQDTHIEPGTNVTVYGWGFTSYPPGPRPTELHVVSRNTISNKDCNNAYIKFDGKNVTDSQVCTEAGGHGTCQGDSGGPLTWIGDDDKVYQVGLVSFGVPCANEYPDVFTKVASFAQWIQDNTE